MQERNADTINQRCYVEVTYGSSYVVEPTFRDLLDTDKEKTIPGFLAPEKFVSNVKKVLPENFASASKGPNWVLVRTGWDNVVDQGTVESHLEPRVGVHFTDLDQDLQRAIRSWCAYYKLVIDFDYEKKYLFEANTSNKN